MRNYFCENLWSKNLYCEKLYFEKLHYENLHYEKLHFEKLHFEKLHFGNLYSGNTVSGNTVPQNAMDFVDSPGEEVGQKIIDYFLHTIDFSNENSALMQMFPEQNLTMEQMLFEIWNGGMVFSPADLINVGITYLLKEVLALKTLFFMVILCAVMESLIRNLSFLNENRQIRQIGTYFIYLLLCIYLFQTYKIAMHMAQNALGQITEFLDIFLPTYYFTVGVSLGPASASGLYQLSLFAIYLVEYVIYLFLLPAVNIYFVLAFVSGLTSADSLKGFLTLLHKGIIIVIKSCFAVVGGLGAIRMLILPLTDGMRMDTLQRVISAIPGIGDISDVTLQMISGALLLIKNGVGVILVLLLLVLGGLPLLRLLVLGSLLMVADAFAEIFRKDAFGSFIKRTSESMFLLVRLLGAGYALHLFVIAIAATCR